MIGDRLSLDVEFDADARGVAIRRAKETTGRMWLHKDEIEAVAHALLEIHRAEFKATEAKTDGQ